MRIPKPLATILIPMAVIAISIVAVGGLAELATSSPRLCASCHAMNEATETWRQSAHAEIRCVTCHEPPREWYEVPKGLVARANQLGRDIYRHVTMEPQSDDELLRQAAARNGQAKVFHEGHSASPMLDEVCLQCHDPDRKATSGYRIQIEHAEHAERNGSCVSCHVDTAHPEPSLGRALSLMARCYTCHGTAEQPEASATCETCHPSDFDLRPPSHEDAPWMRDHGIIATNDMPQCRMCHEQRYCDDCHGLAMPHPDGWAKGASGHATTAERERDVCSRCHTEKPDLCSMCHHKDTFMPARGTWVQQHFIEVEKRGSAYCLDCHLPVYCVRCHVRWSMTGEMTL
jgi:nitrate/TMAO reductase-like tetraheme cytochrome c subunit